MDNTVAIIGGGMAGLMRNRTSKKPINRLFYLKRVNVLVAEFIPTNVKD